MGALADYLQAVSIAKREVHARVKAMLTNLEVVATSLTEVCKYLEVPYEDLQAALKDLENIFPTAEASAKADQATSLDKKVASLYFECLFYEMKQVSLQLNNVPILMKYVSNVRKNVHDSMKLIMLDSEIFSASKNVVNKNLKNVTVAENSKILLADIERTRKDLQRLRSAVKNAYSGLEFSVMAMKELLESVEQSSTILEHVCQCILTVLEGKNDSSEALFTLLY